MGNFNAADVIKAAATSNLGVISLIVLVLAFLAWRFFQRSSDRVKLVAFATMFVGAAGFVTAVMLAGGDTRKPEPKPAAVPTTVAVSPAPEAKPEPEEQTDAPDIAGAWHDSDGYQYAVRQDGEAFTYKVSLKGKSAGRGAGTISGNRLNYRYAQPDGSQGNCEGELGATGRTISGKCRDGNDRWEFSIER